MTQLAFMSNLGATEALILLVVIGFIIVLPIYMFVRNQKLKTQNQYLKKDSLNLDLHKLAEMKDKGLISEDEYQLKKQAILSKI